MTQDQPPQTRTVNASAARQRWSALLGEVFRERSRVIVEKSGIPVAALISLPDLERLEALERQWQERFAALDASWQAFEGVSEDEIEREVAGAVAEARAARRAAQQARQTA